MGIKKFLSREECRNFGSGYLITINMQHLYESRRDPELRRAIFSDPNARHCLDGRGALIVFQRWLRCRLPLAPGNEILLERLNEAGTGARVLVIGSTPDVLAKVKDRFAAVTFLHDASDVTPLNRQKAIAHAQIIEERFGSNYDLVAIALGVPKQEILASALSERMPTIPIYCIGGSFEMLADCLRRAPVLMQRLGLEGVWRLLIQPRRKRLMRLIESYWFFLVLVFTR